MGSKHTERLVALAVLSVMLSLFACGDGGNGGGSGGPADQTTIEGQVTAVSPAAAAAIFGGTEGSQVSGIRVEAQRAGQTLDVATTNLEGRFTLDFTSGGPVEIVFEVEGVVLSLVVDAPPGTVVSLVVELQIVDREVVVIDDSVVESGPIHCDSDRFSLIDDGLDLLIDGDGDDCLRAENDCVLDIAVGRLRLVDCERCIDAHSSAEILVTASLGVTCEAEEDGIRAASSSLVAIEAGGGIGILAESGDGIRAESSAQVFLTAGGACLIDAGEDPIEIESQATVNLDGCADVVLAGDSDDDDDDDDDGFGDDDD